MTTASAPKRGVKTAREHTPTEPMEIVREYAQIQQAEKDLERRKVALKPKMQMLVPTDTDVREFRLPEIPGMVFIARRIRQDRRKPSDDLLMPILEAKKAPLAAYDRKPNHDYIASMIKDGRMTIEELESTMTGTKVEYVSLTPAKDTAGT